MKSRAKPTGTASSATQAGRSSSEPVVRPRSNESKKICHPFQITKTLKVATTHITHNSTARYAVEGSIEVIAVMRM